MRHDDTAILAVKRAQRAAADARLARNVAQRRALRDPDQRQQPSSSGPSEQVERTLRRRLGGRTGP